MSQAQAAHGAAGPNDGAGWRLLPPEPLESGDGYASAQDRAFIALLIAYRPHGGIARLHSLVGGRRIPIDGQEVAIEVLVALGKLFGFQWHDEVWIPMFQFNMPGLTVASGPQRIAKELGRSFYGWALTSWFVRPNSCLAGRTPIDCLNRRLEDVLEAARADRVVSPG
jgi:hypothetical protein